MLAFTMPYLVLSITPVEQAACSHYRGTYRLSPAYRNDLSGNHPANAAVLDAARAGNGIYIEDYKTARNLLRVFSTLEPAEKYELVEAVRTDQSVLAGSELLGFDLAAGFHYSALCYGGDFRVLLGCAPRETSALARLATDYFQARLNTDGLFGESDLANWCLDCLTGINELSQGALWHAEVSIEVIGLYAVH